MHFEYRCVPTMVACLTYLTYLIARLLYVFFYYFSFCSLLLNFDCDGARNERKRKKNILENYVTYNSNEDALNLVLVPLETYA